MNSLNQINFYFVEKELYPFQLLLQTDEDGFEVYIVFFDTDLNATYAHVGHLADLACFLREAQRIGAYTNEWNL